MFHGANERGNGANEGSREGVASVPAALCVEGTAEDIVGAKGDG